MLGLVHLITPFSYQCPAPGCAHTISARQDVYPAFTEMQALWDGKTQATFLTKTKTSQTLWHSSGRFACYSYHVVFMSPTFGCLKVSCLVWTQHHSFLHNKKERAAITLTDTSSRGSCSGRILSFSLHWPCTKFIRLGRTKPYLLDSKRQWKEEAGLGCVTSVFFRPSAFRKDDSNGKSLATLKGAHSVWLHKNTASCYSKASHTTSSLHFSLKCADIACSAEWDPKDTNLHSLTVQ